MNNFLKENLCNIKV